MRNFLGISYHFALLLLNLSLIHSLQFPLTTLKQITASFLLPLSLSPIGNINEAIHAIVQNTDSITCTLDEQMSDESHTSCQLLDKVVRVRANKLITINQNWGGSASTGASIWQGANMASW